jgi:hypothetical protein
LDTVRRSGYIHRFASMKIRIANQDRTDELLPRLSAAAEQRTDRLHQAGRMPDHTALQLGEAGSEDRFLDLFLEHLRRQHGRFAQGYEEIAGRTGLRGRVGSLLQQGVGRLTRAQQQRLLARQALLTELLLAVMEFQRDRHRRQIRSLEDRLSALEAASGSAASSEPGLE